MKTYASPADYRAASVADKARLRATATADLHAAVDALDMDAATAARDAIKSWTDAVASAPVVVDYAAILSARVATLRAAADMIESGTVVPDGIPAGTTMAAGPSPADVDAATRIASAKITRSRVRNNIADAIVDAFTDMPAGSFMSCTDVANKMGLPSAGAVAARHDSWEHDTIVAVDATADRARGYMN